jgi:hypothetical protein
MTVQIDWDFSGDDDAKAEIGAAVRYLLKDAGRRAREGIVEDIIEIVRGAAGALSSPVLDGVKHGPVTYKDYIIDTFKRDTDRWRATIRRSNGKKIRVAVPPSVVDEVTTSADALTAEKAIGLAKKAIDGGGLA